MSLKRHTYRVLLHPLDADSPQAGKAIEFLHRNHDELSGIVDRVQATSGLPAESAAALAVGLKLLAQTMLDHQDDPLFQGLRQPLRDFIGVLKARAATFS